ncbi:MAG: altronate dehydratase [Bacteroidaceae bacterium]|nr:altronate dehydratase [Bacteroidaceae bacterium]
MTTFIKINKADNVCVALTELSKGQDIEIDGKSITLKDNIPYGHKFLIKDIEKGQDVIKYGYPIGHLREDHQQGELVDDRHIQTNLAGLLEYTYNPVFNEDDLKEGNDCHVDCPTEGLPTTFMGYKRKNGDVGVRNELWVIPTVGCVNGVVNQIVQELKAQTGFENNTPGAGIDRIVAFNHNYGCSQLSEDHENTRKILRDMVLHPNAGAVLVVGLGCENNQPDKFEQLLGDYDKQRIRILVTQKVDGDEVEEGVKIAKELYDIACQDKRTETPVSELRIGLKCGGSDGLSGITGNPLLGVLSDYIVSKGGTSVLTEVPEMFGAETILMNRCADKQLFDKTVKLINDFKSYFLSHGEPVGENPSPGNKAGGISTLEDKALGCTQKCGKSAVRGVLDYGERIEQKGLNLLSAPGNDLVASTALAASGCHIVLFTTGRGTPFGTFVPTMKISTNSNLANRKKNWIDFNAGVLAEGATMDDTFREFTKKVIAVANGETTWNEKKDYQEISIFKNGVTL